MPNNLRTRSLHLDNMTFVPQQIFSIFRTLSQGRLEANMLTAVYVLDLVLVHDLGVVIVVKRGRFRSALQAISHSSFCPG
jgi:hypothetical protein